MFLTIKLCTHAKLNFLNRTDFLLKNGSCFKLPTKVNMS